MAIARAGDGSGRLFIVQQRGRIMVWEGGGVLPNPFLDLSPLVSCCGEQGLLGLAFHPRYAASGFFYVYYTNRLGKIVIRRYAVSASDPDVADPASGVVILKIPHPTFTNHNGGQLAFGPDGYLYAGVGDGGGGGDPSNQAQDLGSLKGKLLRIDVDGAFPYAIPAGNPFLGFPGARPEIWVLGLRNPWRFSFDRVTGDLFIGDVGQNLREEIDAQAAASPGGENYGWRRMEGSLCFDPPIGCADGTPTLPILEYGHGAGKCAVTGGFRYRGASVPALAGAYLYGDYCKGRIWGAVVDVTGRWTRTRLLDSGLLVSTFGEDEAGELYVAHHASAPGGAIYRVIPGL